MEYLVYMALPYITLVVLLGGLVWRIHSWWARPRAKAVLFPAAKSNGRAAARVAGDVVLFGKTFRTSKSLWAMAALFHLGLLLVLLGHIRAVTEIGFLWSWLNLEVVSRPSGPEASSRAEGVHRAESPALVWP